MSRFGNRESGFFASLSGGSAISGNPCGSFYDTTIQTATLPNTAYAMKLNSTDANATNLCSVASGSKISVTQSGIYNVQFSSQFQRSSGGSTETIDIWLRQSGSTDVPNTNTHVSVQANNTYIVTAWNFFIYLQANDFVEIMWATTSTAIQLYYDAPSSPHPATPSVIATINRIS